MPTSPSTEPASDPNEDAALVAPGDYALAVFPATFDPVTRGHVDIAERAARVFGRLVLGVYAHPDGSAKQPLFSTEERVALVRAAVAHIPTARVTSFSGLSIEFARGLGAGVIVRGLRVADDFEFERKMAMMNRHLAPGIETMLLISDPAHAFVSASIVREVARMGGDVSSLVPPGVQTALDAKRRSGELAVEAGDGYAAR
ncbi:MAG: pantetheine-phosphate adenylyltransferase [Ardenticatenales bacterium]